ncbi:uncharacterized protein ARMOST_16122 [Armillaria ostoyae]|uniref:Heterokaryon incompatibility domain-containing protein n=1 Tax=Armillaria ostoyae TaxID=47428 RepID=A0A284RVA6_ARMOS|nr:uncharacterized protein ARMOST_16122 [Armillaria ostoyae]
MDRLDPAGRARWDCFQALRKYRLDSEALLTHAKFPEVTISAHTEIGQAEEDTIVPLQRLYTGTKPVISASLANTPCTDFGLSGLLERLNTTLGTSHTLDIPALSSLLEDCIARKYDFGTAYGSLRMAWRTEDWSTIPGKLCDFEEKDREMRRCALRGNHILQPEIYPRRVWDLFSNRVVPTWSTGREDPDPISHAWVDEEDRKDEWTVINGREWPVPIPKDSNLDLIRIEMLNIGLEYVWLDVLCLRQRGGLREDLRVQEWMLDVPTIGYVYYHKMVYCYLSGLGCPLAVTGNYFDSGCCWFNRAWTLQEIGRGRKICGVTPDGPLDAKPNKDGNYESDILARFHQKLQEMKPMLGRVFDVLEEMQLRVSTNPVDRIMGLVFLLVSYTIPAYYESQSLEGAWTALVHTTHTVSRGAIFFLYPEPGNAGAKWRPSWDQVMKKPLPRHDKPAEDYTEVYRDVEANIDLYETPLCVQNGFVRGLAVGGAPGTDRHGKLLVEDAQGIQHSFNVIATHQYPIPEDTYALIGSEEFQRDDNSPHQWVRWVVGRRLPDKRFEKLSVFKMARNVLKIMMDILGRETHEYILV